MELKDYLQAVIRWFWLLLLFMFLGTSSGYLASRFGKPTYQAVSKILVSKDLADQNSQFASMNNQQVIDAYVQLLTSSSVIDEASRRLNIEIDLKKAGSVQQVRSTNVIEITMEDENPEQAAAIVNTLVNVLIDKNTQSSSYASTEESIRKNITQVEGQISTLQSQFNQLSSEKIQTQLSQVNDQITALQNQISSLSAEIGPLAILPKLTAEQSSQLSEKQAQLTQLQNQLSQYQQIRINLEIVGRPASTSSDQGGDIRIQLLQSTLDQYQHIYLDLLDSLQKVQLARSQSAPTIDQIEIATPPIEPVRPQPRIYTILGGIVGLILAIGLIFIVEYLDDTLRTSQDVQQGLGVPVLGYITDVHSLSNTTIGSSFVWQLYSQTSEAINALRTNLEFAGAQSSLKTLLLLGVNELVQGNASISTDLAVSYAQSGNEVVLLDADMRNPGVHRYFELGTENGFSDLLAGDVNPETAGKQVEGIDGLTVITSGNPPATVTLAAAAEVPTLTKPNRIAKILDVLKERSDVTIINAPPITVVDSWVLASKVDGVLLVIQPGVTHLSEAHQSLEQLGRAGAKLMGSVLYEVSRNSLADYFRRFRRSAKKAIEVRSQLRLRPQKEPIKEQFGLHSNPQNEAVTEQSDSSQKEAIKELSEPEPGPQKEAVIEPSEPDTDSQDEAVEEQPEPETGSQDEAAEEQPEPDAGPQDEAVEEQPEPDTSSQDEAVEEQPEPDTGSKDGAVEEPSEPDTGSQDEAVEEQPEPETGSQDEVVEEQPELDTGSQKEAVEKQPEPDTGSQEEAVEEPSEPEPGSQEEAAKELSEPDAGSQKEVVEELSEPDPGSQKEKPRKKRAPRTKRKKSKKNT